METSRRRKKGGGLGNTSDEITGHMYGLSIFLSVGAANAADKTIARSLLNDMMSRIIKGGLILRDVRWDHETRWGHWDPADLNGNFLGRMKGFELSSNCFIFSNGPGAPTKGWP